MNERCLIAVAARKGGVGKTVVACGLASALAHQGRRVLVVDLDPQFNAAYVLGVDPIAPGTAELLTGGVPSPLEATTELHVLPGGHRKAAIAHIRENSLAAYTQQFPDDLVPIRMMPFDADEDPEQALQVEISENEKRRDYTPNEVRALASRLRAAGYVDTPGRPSLGEKRLRPALEVIIGKSLRSVRRYLTEEKPVQVGQISKRTALRQAKRALAQWASLVDEEKNTRTEKQLVQKLPQLLELIEKAITEG